MIDQACTMCANDNLELACAFVQKTATEKAVIEIDKYLKTVSTIYIYFQIMITYIFNNGYNIFFFYYFFRNLKDVMCQEWKDVAIVIQW